MRNLKLVIEYDGTDFSGWQYQPDRRTVQGDIENAIATILAEEVRIIGSGRTDQGVHALGQVANFLTNSPLAPERIRDGINSLTREDIYIKCCIEVDKEFHSRFSAHSKTYRYHVMCEPSPLKQRYAWYTNHSLDTSRMDEVKEYFIGTHDFKFLSSDNEGKSTECSIHRINLTDKSPDIIIIIEGNRFLRKMVRGIVGFMHDVGRGRFLPDQGGGVLAGEVENLFFAPPHGLCLVEVTY